jgi:hypothetical protein
MLHIMPVNHRAEHRRLSPGFATVAAFVAVDLLLTVVCLLLLWQNVTLRREVARDLALFTPAAGTLMPTLIGVDRAGVTQTVDYAYDRRPTLVYAFSRGCGACEQSWAAMRPLQTLAPSRLQIVYLHTSGDAFTPDYLTRTGIGQSMMLVELAPGAPYVYDARAVPQLLLVDPHRRLRWSHLGAVRPANVSSALTMIKTISAEVPR